MNVSMRSTRRRFVTSTLWIGFLAFLQPREAWALWLQRRRSDSLGTRFVEILEHKKSAEIVGLAYLRGVPAEASEETLTERIRSDLSRSEDELCGTDFESLRKLLRLRTRRDFEEGRTVRLEGWIMSRTEARLFALATLV